MRIPDETRDQLSAKFTVLFPRPDERQRRLLMGTEARLLGHGGIRAVARAAQVSETTVRNGVFELECGEEPLGRVRRHGGGRKRVADSDPGLRPALLALVEPDDRGDPTSPLRWTVKIDPCARGGAGPGRAPDQRRYRGATCCGPAPEPDELARLRNFLRDEVPGHLQSHRPRVRHGPLARTCRPGVGAGGSLGSPCRTALQGHEVSPPLPARVYRPCPIATPAWMRRALRACAARLGTCRCGPWPPRPGPRAAVAQRTLHLSARVEGRVV